MDIPSIIIHQDSDEGKAQIERERKKMEESRRFSEVDKAELTEEESEKEKRRRKVCTDKVVTFLIVLNREKKRRMEQRKRSRRKPRKIDPGRKL